MPLSKRARRRLILIAVLAVGAAATTVAGYQFVKWRSQRNFEASLARGLEAFREGRHSETLATLGPLLGRLNSDHEVVFAVASSRFAIPEQDDGHLVPAMRLFRRAAELKEDDLASREFLLELYPSQGFLREAMDTADEVLELSPGHPEALATRARGYAAMGRWSEAAADSEELVRLYPSQERWKQMQVSVALAGGKTPDEVLVLTESWPPADPPDGLNHMIRASLWAVMGRGEEAGPLIDQGVGMGAGSIENLRAMVSMLDDLNRASQSESLIRRFVAERGWTPEISDFATRWAFLMARGDLVREFVSASLAANEPVPAVALARAATLAMASDPAAVQPLLDRLRSATGESSGAAPVEVAMLKGIEALLSLRSGGGLDGYREVVALSAQHPSEEVLRVLAAQASLLVGDAAPQRQLDRRDQQPPSLQQLLLRAEVDLRSGRAIDSVAASLEAMERHPSRIEPAVLLADAWSRTGSLPPELLARIRRATGSATPLDLANRVYEVAGSVPQVARLLLRVAVSAGRSGIAEDVVVAAIGDGSCSVEDLFDLAVELPASETALVGRLRDRIAELRADDPRLAILEVRGGELPVAEIRRRLPLADADAAIRGIAWQQYLAAAGAASPEEFLAAVDEAVAAEASNLRLVSALLSDGRVWADQERVRRLIDATESLLGGDSESVILAKANWVLVFTPEDEAAISSMLRRVNELSTGGSDSLAVGVTLLRLLQSDTGGEAAAAIRLGQRLIARNPEAFELYPLVIDILQRQGMLDEADRYLRQFEQIDRAGILSARQRAGQFFQEGNFAGLVLTLAGLADRSGAIRDLLLLAQAQEATGKWSEAEATYRRAFEAGEVPWDGVSRRASLLARQGRLEEAMSLLSQHEDSFPKGLKALVAGELLLQLGDLRAAERMFAEATEVDPLLPGGWRYLASVRDRDGRRAEAVDAAFKGLALLPDDEILQSLVLGAALQDAETADLVVRSAGQTAMLSPAFTQALQLLRACRREGGSIRPDEAQLRAARELCSTIPGSMIAWRTAVAMHDAAGRIGESRTLAAAAARRFQDAVEPASWQVRLAAAAGDLDEAVRLCLDWRRRSFPDVRAVDQSEATLQLARNRPEEALALLEPYREAILAEAATQPGPYRSLLASLLMTGRAREAIQIASEELSRSPVARSSWARIASMAPAAAAFEAMAALERATPPDIRSRATLIGDWVAFHERHPQGGGLARARALLPATLEPPTDFDRRLITIAASSVAMAAGDPQEAVRLLQSVIDSYSPADRQRALGIMSLPPDRRLAEFMEFEPLLFGLNNMAMNLVEARTDLDRALRCMDDALAILPGEPNLLDSRAQVLLALGQLAEAERAVAGAVGGGAGGNPEVALTAAEVLLANGRVRDARQLLQGVRAGIAAEPWPSQKLVSRLARLEELARD